MTFINPMSRKSMRELIHERNPYTDFDPIGEDSDLQGWGSDDPIFEYLIRKIHPSLIIEIGTWKGRSAINMAAICRSKHIDCEIVCVDTWLGSAGLFTRTNDPFRASLAPRHGYPQLYYTFLSNVVRAGFQDNIVPLPLPSLTAAEVLLKLGVLADLVYIDASHDYKSALDDFSAYWELLSGDGVLFGDDYVDWPGVTQAANEFAAKVGRPIFAAKGKFMISKSGKFVPEVSFG